jgi:hypothetical protein
MSISCGNLVIASKAKQSRVAQRDTGLLRRFASRNDDSFYTSPTGTRTANALDAIEDMVDTELTNLNS